MRGETRREGAGRDRDREGVAERERGGGDGRDRHVRPLELRRDGHGVMGWTVRALGVPQRLAIL